MGSSFFSAVSWYQRTIWTFIILLASISISGCGGGTSNDATPDPDAPNEEQRDTNINFLPNKSLGFVSDPDGNLVPFASIGGAVTDKTGIASGVMSATTSGWYAVEADGYATTYTESSGQVNGVDIVSAILTPVDTEAFHPVGGTTVVEVGPLDAPLLSATFDAADFSVDAVVEVTALDPALLDTTYASMNTNDKLYISQPFEINARSAADGTLLQPVSGQVVEVTLADAGTLGNPPRLFWFDPEQGMWIEQLNVCTRADVDHVTCQLSHFSQHAGAGSTPPPPSGKGSAHARATNTSNQALQDGAEGAAANGGGMCDVFTPALVNALMAEVEAALAEAKNHPSEAAKKMVADTAGRLQLIGGYGPADNGCDVFPAEWEHSPNPYEDLIQALEDVTKKLAADLLVNPQCPDLDAMNKVLAEAQLLSVEEAPIPTLENKYYELLDQCNIWEGRVEFSIMLPDSSILNQTTHFSGPRYWTEYHDIVLRLHASASGTDSSAVGTFDGTDTVETHFARVSYREADEICSPVMYSIEDDFWGEPNGGEMAVSLTGQFDPQTGFAPESATADNPITLNHQMISRQIGFSGETGCYTSFEIPITFGSPFPYRGQVAEKTFHTWEGQPVIFMNGDLQQFSSLWQILNRAPSSTQPGGPDSYPREFFRGMEILNDVMVPFGLPDMHVVMRWNIMHTDYTKGR